jgi:hypothetical protein
MIGCPGREHYCSARSDQHPFHQDQRRVDAFREEAAFGGDSTSTTGTVIDQNAASRGGTTEPGTELIGEASAGFAGLRPGPPGTQDGRPSETTTGTAA